MISAWRHVACTSSAQSGSGQWNGLRPRLMLRSLGARGAIVSGGERGHRARTAVPVVEGGIPQRGGKATGDSVVGQIHLAQARVRGEPVRGGPGQPVRLERERAEQRQIAKLARDGALELVPPRRISASSVAFARDAGTDPVRPLPERSNRARSTAAPSAAGTVPVSVLDPSRSDANRASPRTSRAPSREGGCATRETP